MKKTIYYTYLGTNGTLTSVIHLPDIYSIKKYLLEADEGNVLTKDFKHFVSQITVSEEEVKLWSEVKQT